MIKLISLDAKDGKIDGLVGKKKVHEIDDDDLIQIGVEKNSINKLKEKFQESYNPMEATSDEEVKLGNSFIGKIKTGVQNYASKKALEDPQNSEAVKFYF